MIGTTRRAPFAPGGHVVWSGESWPEVPVQRHICRPQVRDHDELSVAVQAARSVAAAMTLAHVQAAEQRDEAVRRTQLLAGVMSCPCGRPVTCENLSAGGVDVTT